jgi:protein subunit release factor B
MTLFSVSEAKNRWLQERMKSLGIREEELEEKFIRSSGKGGQHVNKTSTCVWLKHLPTGIEVKCMAERSQSLNRFLARRELAERVEALAGLPTRRSQVEEKVKKQKAKRKKRAADKYEKIEPEKPLTGEDAEERRGKTRTSNGMQSDTDEAN